MTGAEAAAAMIGGLGLFFIGIRELSANLQRLVGRRVRTLMAKASAGPIRAALTGLAIGVVIQSSNAATFVTTSLLTAGLLPLRSALTAVAWSNVGPAGLVLLATLDLRLGILWLLGVIGFANLLGFGNGPRWQPMVKSIIALALAMLGLTLVKSAGGSLQGLDPALLQAWGLGSGDTGPFIAGLLISMVVQSSSTPAILMIKLGEAGLLSFDQLCVAIYGATIGSGLALLLVGRHLKGAARQVILFQVAFKALSGALFIGVFEIEHLLAMPGIEALAAHFGHGSAGGLALLFLFVQIGGCVLVTLFRAPLLRLILRLAPITHAETLGKPDFIYPRAAEDPSTALDLAAREADRLQARLPPLLDQVRDGAPPGSPKPAALMDGGAALETEITRFLADVLARSCPPDAVARAVTLENRLDLLTNLRETLGSFQAVLQQVQDPAIQAITLPLAESLHFLLEQLNDAQTEADRTLLLDLASDRGEMMETLRRQATSLGAGLAYATHDQLFRATALFERAVWLVRRVALLRG